MAIFNDLSDCPATSDVPMTVDAQDELEDGEERASLCEQNGAMSPTTVFNPYYTGRPRTPMSGHKYEPIDRQEIIRRIKSRESRPASPELNWPTSAHAKKTRSPTPLPAFELEPHQRAPSPERQQGNEAIGMQIERPRSALHRGDFREKEHANSGFGRFRDGVRDEAAPSLSTSPVAPWHPDFPTAVFRQAREQRQRLPSPPRQGFPIHRPQRGRASTNAALASGFVYKPPTSPLVQSSRPDTPEPGFRPRSRSPDKSRRHTFSPNAFRRFQSTFEMPSAQECDRSQPPSLRQERTFPYQAHQPRRSLNSFQSLPQTPLSRSRRPSFTDPLLHHAPMVGSYEESILRGRMSTTPSKPLNFVAQIGVLGRGNCKPSLRCPPHVIIPFPAVFYSNPSASKTTDQPSPYVGLIDVENNLPYQQVSPDKRRHRLNAVWADEGGCTTSKTRDDGSASDVQARRRRQKQKRRSGSPRAPSGGSYRIPQQGQLQIIIKNPNKTAVKLFLVPYDLSDMEPGQKTFIRQRSYSAGPIIDMPLSSRKNLGTDRPEAALNVSDDPNERPMLRYLIHLHVCCPSKGRYFLYKSIRVVFANRVPDGKEKLRNEIQLPEPRYSIYKQGRDSTVGLTASASPRASARRRSGVEPSISSQETPWPQHGRYMAQSLPSANFETNFGFTTQPLPFHINPLSPLESRPASRQTSDGMDIDSDPSQEMQSSQSPLSSPTWKNSDPMQVPLSSIAKLEDPFNFERDRGWGRQAGGVRNESLLSRRLKDLVVEGALRQDGGGSADEA